MTPVRPARRFAALVLLTVLVGSFFLSVFSDRWYEALPWHDHIVLGPMLPGWENHHHGPWAYPGGFGHPPWACAAARPGSCQRAGGAGQHGLTHSSGRGQVVSLATGIGVDSMVLSLYRLPEGGTSVFSFAAQLLQSAAGWTLPELSPFLSWPLSLGFLILSSLFLRPPEKPPRVSLYLSPRTSAP